MVATFGIQFYQVVSTPEFEAYAPTYDYVDQFDVDYTKSMLAIKLNGIDSLISTKLTQEQINENIRVSFYQASNQTYFDAVYCKDLYSE